MSYIFDKVPYFKGYVRREFTRNLEDGFGDFLPAVFVGVRCQRGLSLYFQAWLTGYGAGACFLAPIHACVAKPCEMPPKELIQPWDVFSPDFGVSRIDLFHRSRIYAIPHREPGRYLMTFDFTNNELADDLEQHKHLHLVEFDGGHFGAFPNNRLLFEDLAFFDKVAEEKPDFAALKAGYYSE